MRPLEDGSYIWKANWFLKVDDEKYNFNALTNKFLDDELLFKLNEGKPRQNTRVKLINSNTF
jgi:hypothetical protein